VYVCPGGRAHAELQNKEFLDLQGARAPDAHSREGVHWRVRVSRALRKSQGKCGIVGGSGTYLHHESPSGCWVLDQLHLPRFRKHWSRHMLVLGTLCSQIPPPCSLTQEQGVCPHPQTDTILSYLPTFAKPSGFSSDAPFFSTWGL
jgi:hypothetical protein